MARTFNLPSIALLALSVLCPASTAFGQAAAPADALPASFTGPPPPVAPAVVSRDPSNRVTLRAVRVMEPIRVDGRLDEARGFPDFSNRAFIVKANRLLRF